MVRFIAHKGTRYLPTIGIFTYVVLYLIAAEFYPGGSSVYPESIGFDWTNNYWCHLVGDNAINGQKNLAQPYAVSGMIILGISLGFFFKQFPIYFKVKSPWDTIVPISGVLGSFFSMLIMTGFHDLTAVVAAVFGSIAIIGIFFGLKNSKMIHFVWTGVFCVLLIALNGYIYFTENYIQWLPIIQKITFVAVLLWVVFLNSIFSSERKIAPMKESLS